jgi:hypothetical protein
MEMVGHEHVGMQREAILARKFAEDFLHAAQIRFIAKDRAMVDPALQDMVHAT